MSNSLSKILNKLNLLDKEGLFYYKDLNTSSKLSLTVRVRESLSNKIKPDAFFCISNEPLILFFDNPDNINAIYKKCWNFNQAPVIFIIQPNNISIYNGFNYLKEDKTLSILSNNYNDFDYFKIITGETWEKYNINLENKNRVDAVLLKSIENARNKLIIEFALPIKTANFLIGRIIFIRYLIDRKVELNKYGILSKEDFYKILASKQKAYQLFRKIKKDFNGNLFPVSYTIDSKEIDEEDIVENSHLSVIIDLLRGTDITNGQLSFFDIFDFEILPIEFISNVYEKFIGKNEQAKNGAYYTPLFLVDYIQKETVSKYFEENTKEYNCKVLDPACGSGIFLVETYRQIITQYQKNKPNYKSNITEYKETLKSLLVDNLFGIDKDESAISVAIFSLYITLLDYLEPSSIVDFQFPPLINTNFFAEDFFDTKVEFNTILKNIKLQFILGNPPWCTTWGKEKQQFENYIDKRNKTEVGNLEIENREIAEAFLVRVSDFNVENCALIVTSKILYKTEKKGIFRSYFLSNFKINQVFELSSVRHQIFDKSNDKAVAPTTILFYSKSNNIENNRKNVIKHISLKPNLYFETFKLLVIEKYDYKEIQQKYFIDNDWAWKIFVYGNLLDYQLINRLKNNFPTIEKITSDSNHFIKGQGLKFNDGNKKVNTEKFKNYQFLGSLEKKITKNGDIKDALTNYKDYLIPFAVNTNLKKWDKRDVGYFPENPIIFEAPSLFITGGITKDFKSVSAISYNNSMFKSSITAIKAIDDRDLECLKSISAILNSSLFAYYILSIGSSTGIEREETHDEEKWAVPYVSSKYLIELVSSAEKLASNHFIQNMENDFEKNELERIKLSIDKELIKLFQFSAQEKQLVDYTNTITIPLLKGNELTKSKILGKVKLNSSIIQNYTKVFVNHFGKRFNSDGKYFEAEIIYSNHTILIKFKVIKNPSKNKECINWTENTDENLLQTISKLNFEKHSSSLFIQKDIKGFEKDFFYVAKPNQYKSWHPAIAYLDLAEFMGALHDFKPKSKKND